MTQCMQVQGPFNAQTLVIIPWMAAITRGIYPHCGYCTTGHTWAHARVDVEILCVNCVCRSAHEYMDVHVPRCTGQHSDSGDFLGEQTGCASELCGAYVARGKEAQRA